MPPTPLSIQDPTELRAAVDLLEQLQALDRLEEDRVVNYDSGEVLCLYRLIAMLRSWLPISYRHSQLSILRLYSGSSTESQAKRLRLRLRRAYSQLSDSLLADESYYFSGPRLDTVRILPNPGSALLYPSSESSWKPCGPYVPLTGRLITTLARMCHDCTSQSRR